MIERVLLCRKREMPPGSRSKGFKILPPEALYDPEAGPFQIQHDWKILRYGSAHYVRTESFFPGGERVYELSSCTEVA